jgi:hypothetical protein
VQHSRATSKDVLGLLVLSLFAIGAAACGAPATPNPTGPGESPAESSAASVSAVPSALVETSPSVPPAASAPVLEGPSTEPSPGSASPGVTPTATPGGPDAAAAVCSGSSDVKDFFVAIAQAVPWHVYCAVLPAGWSVEGGTYRLAAGGRMEMSYKTASGGHLELREGHWCTDGPSACSPRDADLGPGSFGAETGDVTSSGGGFVLYVDPGQNPSWTATATGIDEATFRQLCARLALVNV